MTINTIITPNRITVVFPSEAPKSLGSSDPLFPNLRDAIQRKATEDEIRELLEPKEIVHRLSGGRIEVRDEAVFINGEESHGFAANRLLEMVRDGYDAEPLANFLTKIEQNPSFQTRQDLYEFLEYGGLALYPDGDFTAYKYVREDYFDVHSGTVLHALHTTVSMDRRDCDDNRNNTCSRGLHFCSYEYLPNYTRGRRILQLKINPANVVAIPNDYRNTKGRACEYFVYSELTQEAGGVSDSLRTPVTEGQRTNFNISGIRAEQCGADIDFGTPDGTLIFDITTEGLQRFSSPKMKSYFETDRVDRIALAEAYQQKCENFGSGELLDADLVQIVDQEDRTEIIYDTWLVATIGRHTGKLELAEGIVGDEVPFETDQNGRIMLND
jgi:hypothetical protein